MVSHGGFECIAQKCITNDPKLSFIVVINKQSKQGAICFFSRGIHSHCLEDDISHGKATSTFGD
jgi:hypothetical protein